jgi:hypothetical protein
MQVKFSCFEIEKTGFQASKRDGLTLKINAYGVIYIFDRVHLYGTSMP